VARDEDANKDGCECDHGVKADDASHNALHIEDMSINAPTVRMFASIKMFEGAGVLGMVMTPGSIDKAAGEGEWRP
jgi:hypothetical protein